MRWCAAEHALGCKRRDAISQHGFSVGPVGRCEPITTTALGTFWPNVTGFEPLQEVTRTSVRVRVRVRVASIVPVSIVLALFCYSSTGSSGPAACFMLIFKANTGARSAKKAISAHGLTPPPRAKWDLARCSAAPLMPQQTAAQFYLISLPDISTKSLGSIGFLWRSPVSQHTLSATTSLEQKQFLEALASQQQPRAQLWESHSLRPKL